MTYEAKEAIGENRTRLELEIDNKLRWLSEPALKGVEFEARENAKIESDGPLWVGIAEAAERYHESKFAGAREEGVWCAVVEILRWDPIQRTGETIATFHEGCELKPEAEEAARRLLTENAKHFTAETAVDTEVLWELDWDAEAEAKLL